VPADIKSSAVFRLLTKNGQRLWEHIEEGSLWNFPVSIIKDSRGHILISIENDYSPTPRPSRLVFTLVSDKGVTLQQRAHTVSIRPISFSGNHAAVNANGNLVVAIGGEISAATSSSQASRVWVNPQTGTKRFCINSGASELFEIDVRTLDLKAKKAIQNVSIASVKVNDGRLYVTGSVSANCQLDTRAVFSELGPDLDLTTIFESKNVNSLEVHDLAFTSDGFVLLAGATRTFLPTALTVAVMSFEQLKAPDQSKAPDPWDESFWEKNTEEQRSAFVLALRKDGTVLGDRVFLDLRNRSISTLATETPDRLIAVGSAFGDRGWVVGLRLGNKVVPTFH
jgi:hypothetical protein